MILCSMNDENLWFVQLGHRHQYYLATINFKSSNTECLKFTIYAEHKQFSTNKNNTII